MQKSGKSKAGYISLHRDVLQSKSLAHAQSAGVTNALWKAVFYESKKSLKKSGLINEHLDSASALEFKKSLIKLGYKIADAAGKLFGLGSRSCKQEKRCLKLLPQY